MVTVGGVTYTVTSSDASGSDDQPSVQVSIDLTKAIAELPKLGFAGSDKLTTGGSNSATACAQNSTGEAKTFLTRNPCSAYSVALLKLSKETISTQAAVTWVTMTSPSLTVQYKDIVDERYAGNPPGQHPATFNGLCYASGRDSDSAWVTQIQPTGNVAVDRQILQAVSPGDLSRNYINIHCIG